MPRDQQLESRICLHNERGDALVERGWIKEAIREFEKALELDPDCAQSHDNVANVYAQEGRFLDAMRAHMKALELDPQDATLHYNFAVFLATHSTALMIKEYKEASILEWDFPDVHLNLGVALAEQGEMIEAIRRFKTALNQNPADLGARFELASAFIEIGRYGEAIFELRKVVREDEEYEGAFVNLGICYIARGFYDEAEKALLRAIELDPSDTLALYHLAAVNALKGQNEACIELLGKAARINRVQVKKWLESDRYFEMLRQDKAFLHLMSQT
jgi:tetratricopeptide (TPR) repeat protein